MDDRIYSKPEVLLGDLRGGICSSGLCRQLRAVAADEIERLNKWADGFSDAQLKERQTGELYQRELRAEVERLRSENAQLRRWYSDVIGLVAPERLGTMPSPSSAGDEPHGS